MGLLDNFDVSKIYGAGGPGDPLIALGMGLLSQRGVGRGLASGMQNVAATSEMAHQRQQEEARAKLLAAQTARALQPTYQFHTEPNTGVVYAINPQDPNAGLTPLPGQTPTHAWHWAQPNELPSDYKGPPVAVGKSGPIYPPANTVINNQPAQPNKVFDVMKDRADEARSVAQSLPAFSQARQLLDSGNMTLGPGADTRLMLQKVGGMFGLDASSAENTEVFRSTVAPVVLGLVKGLGAGAGISNADREFAEKAAGGNINLEPGSIRRLMDIGERAARYKLDTYNRTLDQVYPASNEQNAQTRALFGVQVPDIAPSQPSAPVTSSAPAPGKPSGKMQPIPQDILSEARHALQVAPHMKVEIMNRLMKAGYDPSGL